MDEQKIEDLARGAFEEALAFGVNFDVFHRIAKAVAAAEREACAAACDATADEWDDPAEAYGMRSAVAVIRARSNDGLQPTAKCAAFWRSAASTGWAILRVPVGRSSEWDVLLGS